VLVSADPVRSPDGDARVIELSWDEPERLAAIFARYFGKIHRYLARRVGVRAADDLAGEVFLAGFAQRKRYDITRGAAERPQPGPRDRTQTRVGGAADRCTRGEPSWAEPFPTDVQPHQAFANAQSISLTWRLALSSHAEPRWKLSFAARGQGFKSPQLHL
jgi:hypothetical protein